MTKIAKIESTTFLESAEHYVKELNTKLETRPTEKNW
jgi:hypothetical protein